METLIERYLIEISIIGIILFIIYRKGKNKEIINSKGHHHSTKLKIADSSFYKISDLEDENIKPTDAALKNIFSDEKFKLYELILIEYKKIGSVDFFWKGRENGWTLSIIIGDNHYGNLILKYEFLIGQNHRRIDYLSGDESNYVFERIDLKSITDVQNYIDLLIESIKTG